MREAWQQHQRHRQQQRRRAAIAAWQPRLLALAADLPAQAWLTRLDYQGAVLTVNGLALNLQALAGLERILTNVAGFAPAKRAERSATPRDAGSSVLPLQKSVPMWISSRRSQAVLLTLFAMGGWASALRSGALTGRRWRQVSRDPVLQMQWRRVMALRIPAGEIPVEGIDKQPFSPIAIPLAGGEAYRPGDLRVAGARWS